MALNLHSIEQDVFDLDSPPDTILTTSRDFMANALVRVSEETAASNECELKTVEYVDGQKVIRRRWLMPSADGHVLGPRERDIMIYATSRAGEIYRDTAQLPRSVTFTFHEFHTACGSTNKPGGRDYANFASSVTRLAGVLVVTEEEREGKGRTRGQHLIESYDVTWARIAQGRELKGVTLTFSTMLYDMISADPSALSYPRAFFRLSPMLKRLFEIIKVAAHDAARATPPRRCLIKFTDVVEMLNLARPAKKIKSDITNYIRAVAADPSRAMPEFDVTLEAVGTNLPHKPPLDRYYLVVAARTGRFAARPNELLTLPHPRGVRA